MIALAVGVAGGFVYGDSWIRSDNKRELVEAQERAQSMTEKVQASEVSIAKIQAERDKLKAELSTISQDRDEKLAAAKQREDAPLIRAREEVVQQQKNDEAQKAEMLKRVETVRVGTVREALKIHENPKNYVGKKIVVPSDIAFIIGSDFYRHAESDGYLISWECGATASGAERLGSSVLQDNKLNYWCDTDTGIQAKEKLKAKYVGDNIYYNRASLTFDVKIKKIKERSREQEYYFAELALIYRSSSLTRPHRQLDLRMPHGSPPLVA